MQELNNEKAELERVNKILEEKNSTNSELSAQLEACEKVSGLLLYIYLDDARNKYMRTLQLARVRDFVISLSQNQEKHPQRERRHSWYRIEKKKT